MAKFDLSKLADAKWIGVAMAGFAAIGAFMSSMQDQQKDKMLKDLAERVAKLEGK